MKKRLFTAMALVMLAILLPLTVAQAFETFLAETETRLYKPEKCYPGYFQTCPNNAGAGGTVYILDYWGNWYHKWEAKGGTPMLQEDGTLWSIFYIQDWDGNVLWDYVPTRDAGESFGGDHDVKKMWNKKLNQWTMLINCNRDITEAEALAAGVDPAIASDAARRKAQNFVIEVNMDKKIVWRWNQWDHTCQTTNPAWPRYVADAKDAPGKDNWSHMSDDQLPSGKAGMVYDYHHVNTVDFNEDTGHVVMSEKAWGQFVVVDHDKTFVSTTDFSKNIAAAAGPDGDRIYRFGIPASYNRGTPKALWTEGTQQLYGQHDIQWIKPYHWKRPHLATDKWPDPATYTKSGVALPGAGNFIVFDNGNYNPTGMRSRVIEVNPTIGASGKAEVPYGQYIPEWQAGWTPIPAGAWGMGMFIPGMTDPTGVYWYKSKQIVWLWNPQSAGTCYSSTQAGQTRLPNGNTFIASGPQGHLFEVTPSGEVVWEYLYPYSGAQLKTIATDGALTWVSDANKAGTSGGTGVSYRAYRYGADHPAFTGRTMVSQGTLTGRIPRLVGSSDTYPAAVTYTGFGFGGTGVAVGGGGGTGGTGGGAGGGGY